MSAESRPGSHMPEFQHMHTFPLSEKAVGDSIAWLSYVTARSPENLRIEENTMKSLDPDLYAFFAQMYELRGQIQLSEEQLAQYMNGAIFGVNVLANQFEHVGLVLPPANKAALATYFKSLITNHNNFKNIDMQYNILVVTQPGMLKGPVTPIRLKERFRENPSDPLLYDVEKRFNQNSTDSLARMWKSEPHLKAAVPALNNVLDDGRRGFFLGMLDAYAPFKMDHVVGPYAEVLDTLGF